MTVQVSQEGGAGDALPNRGLNEAWLGIPVTISIPDAIYREWLIVDSTDGTTPTLDGGALSDDGRGSVRVRARWRNSTTALWSSRYVVIRFERDEDGENYAPAPPCRGESAEETGSDRGANLQYDRTLSTALDAAASVSSVASGVPLGVAQTLPDSDSTLTSAQRARQATLAGSVSDEDYTAVRTQEVLNGSVVGARRLLSRTAKGRGRLRFVDEAGALVAWANRPGEIEAEWDGSTWRAITPQRIAKVFRPEDFADPAFPDVGKGTDAEADTRAIEAMRTAINNGTTDYASPTQNSFELTAEVVFEAPTYLLNRQIDWYGTDYTTLRIRGAVQGWTLGRTGTQLRWAGPLAKVMSGTPALTFNRAARTIVRSAGSWLTDGFAVGMLLYCNKTTGNNRRLFRISAISLDGLTLTIAAPAANPVAGFDTSNMMPYDEVAASGYTIVQALSMFRVVGASGFEIKDLIFYGRNDPLGEGRPWSCLHFDIEPDVLERSNASTQSVENCGFIGVLDHASACAVAVGRAGSVNPIGSQCDTIYFRHCQFVGNLADVDHASSGIAFQDGNNTKSFWIDDCSFSYHRYGVDHRYASEILRVNGCRFETCWSACIYNAGVLYLSSSQGERNGAVVLGSTGHTTMLASSFNLKSTDNIVSQQATLNAHGCQFINYGTYLEVLSVNAGTETFSVYSHGEKVPANGDVVVIRHMTLGEAGLPGQLQGEETYFLDSVTPTGGANYTCRLYRTAPPSSGGTLASISTTGTAGLWLLSPVIFQLPAHTRAAPAGGGLSLDSCGIWGAEKRPFVVTTVAYTNGNIPVNLLQYSVFARTTVRHCRGINHTRQTLLYDASTVPEQNGSLLLEAAYPPFMTDCEILYSGRDGWACVEFDYSRVKINASTIHRFYIPYRTGIVRMAAEIVADSAGNPATTGFTGTSLTGLTLKVGIHDLASGATPDDDNLLTAFQLVGPFTNARDRRWGFTNAQRGVDLQLGAEWWQYNTGTDRGWEAAYTAFDVTFTPAGGALANLTAGRVRLYVKLEQIPKEEVV